MAKQNRKTIQLDGLKITKPEVFEVGPPPNPSREPPQDRQHKGRVQGSGKTRLVPAEPPKPVNRLTVVETLYHQAGYDEPESFVLSYERDLTTNEQVYDRRGSVGEEWQDLRFGWLTDENINCSLLRIVNHEGQQFQTIPTPEELAEVMGRVLEFCYAGGEETPFLVRPKESTKLSPSTLKGLRIRCRKGTARYTVTAFPE